MITIDHLSVFYKKFHALNLNTEITINAGDRVGIIGSNGAGKSTFIKACLGMIPYQGKIRSAIKPDQMAVHMQANMYQENLKTKLLIETILDTTIQKNPALQDMIQYFDFESSLNKKFKELSGGQKQRMTLILILMQDAPITFFDEVTTGLDFETRQSLMILIKSWYAQKQNSLFFVTHYFEELEQFTNKLLILDHGKLVDYGTTESLFKKYCGYSIITVERGTHDQDILSFNPKEVSSALYSLRCESPDDERIILDRLHELHVNFSRNDNNLEVLFMNAIHEFSKGAHHA